jgi:hypothetical protein
MANLVPEMVILYFVGLLFETPTITVHVETSQADLE